MAWLHDKGLLERLTSSIGELLTGGDLTANEEVMVTTLFGLMGYLAGADRIVTSHEADFANQLMAEIGLPASGCKQALAAFESGRKREIDVDAQLKAFLAVYPAKTEVAEKLYNAVLELALADDRLRPTERAFLAKVTTALGYSDKELDRRLSKL